MIEAEKAIERLQGVVERIELLKGRKIGGLAIVIPPDGDIVQFVLDDEGVENKGFFAYLMDRIKQSLEVQRYGGVNMPPGMGLR